MVKKKKNITIIVIIIISVVVVGGVLTWGFLTNWGQRKKSEPVKYTVTKKIPKGNKIEIENPESHGFKIGQEIEIGTGESRERRTIVGFGSLILDRPLTKDYPENTEITVVEEPIKKDFKVANCKEYTVDLTCKECGDSYYLEDNKCKKYSYTGTQDECKIQDRKIFTAGTFSSDQTCVKCGKEQWVDTINGKQVCKKYSYTGTQDECNKNKGIFTKGTSSSDQTCVDCEDKENKWVDIGKQVCKNYTTTQKNCTDKGKWFDSSTNGPTSDATCYDVIESLEVLKKLLNTPAKGGYRMSSNEYILGNKNYGPIRTWRLGENVTDLSRLFQNNRTFNGDISGWDVSNVTDMNNMFNQSWFNGDLSKWDVSKVEDMSYMFGFATFFNGDLSKWNTKSVKKMQGMFTSAMAFTGTGQKNINTKSATRNKVSYTAWDVSKVTNMSSMFYYAKNFNGDLSNWNVSSVTTMQNMFYYATKFNKPLNDWNISSGTTKTAMFVSASALKNCNKPDQTPCSS